MDFDWHDAKSEECLVRRGFDFDYALQVFASDPEEFTDERDDYGETRVIAFGQIQGRRIAVVYTQRGDVRWIISAFPYRQKEVERWKRRAAAGR